jgi:hypothetical protein
VPLRTIGAPCHRKSKKSKSVSKKEKERSPKAPPFAPKRRSKDNGSRKGPVEKDRKEWGKGEGLVLWDGKKGRKVVIPLSDDFTAKPYSRTDTKSGPTKENCRDQAAGPKDFINCCYTKAQRATRMEMFSSFLNFRLV